MDIEIRTGVMVERHWGPRAEIFREGERITLMSIVKNDDEGPVVL